MFCNGGGFTLQNTDGGQASFESCTANAIDGGGAICEWNSGDLCLTGTAANPIRFISCKNTNGHGGALFSSQTVHLTNCVFDGCEAKTSGGAVQHNGTGTIVDCTVTNCTSTTTGGAVQHKGTGTIVDCTFTNCTSTTAGGAIWNEGTANYSRLSISNCTAGTNGGAIEGNGGSITDSTITNCTASGTANKTGYGGAIYVSGGTLTFSNCEITGCTAKLGGGAVYATGGTATMNGGEVTGNHVTSATATVGGAMETSTTGVLRFKGAAKVYGNTYNSDTGRNVLLNADRNGSIYADGLTAEAEINVFVTNAMRDKHGNAGRSFALYTDAANLDRFVSERYTGSGGALLRGVATSNFYDQKQVCWDPEDVVLTVVSSADGVTPVAGARFELYRDGWDADSIVWRGTTDENGQLSITWTGNEVPLEGDGDGGGTAFIYDIDHSDRQYAMRQIKTGEGYALPGGYWTVNDYADAGYSTTVAQTAKTNYTYGMTISHIDGIDTATCGALGTQWLVKNDLNTMLVQYNLNDGGAGATFSDGAGNPLENPQTVHFSTDSAVADETVYTDVPTRQDHRFLGWNTQADGKGVAYAAGDPLYHRSDEVNGVMTLYAQWGNADSIARVSFDNGATWSYYGALITGEYDGETVNGAFDAAKSRLSSASGTVIIETLRKEHPRYTLNSSFEFNGNVNSTTLIFRTMPSL